MSDDSEPEPALCACATRPMILQLGSGSNWQVICRRCERRGPTAGTRWFAVKLWNNDRKGITTTTKEHEE